MNCEAEYYTLPFIYNSFISVKAIDATKRQTTDFFLSLNPDVYSGVAVANTVGRFVHARKRLRITGASSHSTGASYFSKDEKKSAATKFLSEGNIPFHPAIQFCPSYSYLVAESYLKSFDGGLNPEEEQAFDLWPFVKTAIKEANSKLKHKRTTIIDATRYIAEYNQSDRQAIEKLINSSQSRWKNIIGYDIKKYLYPFMLFDASEYGVENIYDACLLHQQIYERPAHYVTGFYLEKPKTAVGMSEQEPLVSVIMPVYNGERFIAESIESVLNQTHRNLELIILNNGSTDRTGEILAVTFIGMRGYGCCFTPNRWVMRGRPLNMATRHAKGVYIAKLDADDLAVPERLARQVAFLQVNPAIFLVGSYLEVINEKVRK